MRSPQGTAPILARLVAALGALWIGAQHTHAHEPIDYIGRCKAVAEATVTRPDWIQKWWIDEQTVITSVDVTLRFRHPRIEDTRSVLCSYSNTNGQLENLVIDGFFIQVNQGKPDPEFLLELKK